MFKQKRKSLINTIKSQFTLTVLLLSSVLFTASVVHAEDHDTLENMANLLILATSSEPFMDAGDAAKDNNDYMGALAYYAAASEKFDDEHYPTYQTAAALAYMENPELAEEYLKKADERGLWEYLLMEDDDELDFISDTQTYKTVLNNAKQRYNENAKDAGEAFIYTPTGNAPDGGWPVIVWLHGSLAEGDPETYMAKSLSRDKAIVVGINGVYKYREDSFYWSFEEFESTQKAVEEALQTLSKQAKFNKNKVALIGFSLGAMHATQLVANYPEDYAGALILSPGGSPKALDHAVPENKKIAIRYGENEAQGNINLAKEVQTYFEKNNTNTVAVSTHKGGHSFSSNWEDDYSKALADILGYSID